MKSTFVIEIWKAVSPTEYRILLQFLDAPLHNQREDVRLLARLLADTPASDYDHLDKTSVFAFVFPDQPYDALKLNYTCSFLAQRIESYFAWQEMQTDGFWKELLLCRALRRRDVYAHYLRKTEKTIREMEAQPLRNATHHLFRYLLERERYEYRVLHERETPSDLTGVIEPLQHFFMLENLRWAGTALSLQARYGILNNWPFYTPVLEEAAKADVAYAPEIVLARLGYETLKDVENEENFRSLKALILEKGQLFSPGERRDIYLLAINFCLRRHNRGERPVYTKEALELYRAALKSDLFLENNLMQKFTYNNIVRLACIAGEWTWAKDFLETYQTKLPEEERENIYRFNLASWHYLAGEYSRVPALLQTFEYADRDTQLNARQMLLRSFFELQEWQALDSLLHSFYSFLRRRHDIGYQRLNYLNLIKFTRKLMKGALPRRKAMQLAARIRNEPYVAEREWLLGKLGV
jgi:hypothetical protein